MELRILDTQTFYSALINACKHLISQKDNLNAINLFPVADGDTGDNMAATALAVINYSSLSSNLSDTLKSISNAAISGARGNSGMIFSQFFNGLSDHLPIDEPINTSTFAQWITKTIQGVREAILNPVEGTIITAMDHWSATCVSLAADHHCFKSLLNDSVPSLDKAVQDAACLLDVLKEANVVDAGALGFYHFVYGFSDYLSNPQEAFEEKKELIFDTADHHFDHQCLPDHRYCTEALISAEGINKTHLVNLLEPFGDSIVLSGNQNLCRFHMHTNTPADVFKAVQAIGTIAQPKIDDMLRQFEILHKKKHSIALVTDSSVNIPQDILDHYQINLIPLHLYFDEHHFLDHYCVNKDFLYDNLKGLKKYPTTSLPNLESVKSKFRHLSKHYDDVLVISLSQVLSGTHDVLVKSSEEMDNIHVINSRHTAGSQGLLVQHAGELIEQGMSITDIKNELHTKIDKTHLFVLVDQFDSLIRSGRVSKTSGRIAQFTHLKPIITLNPEGKAVVCDKAFSQNKGLAKLITLVKGLNQAQEMSSYNIIHAGIPEKAKEFAELTTESFGQPPEYIDTVSSVIGLHSGKGCIALSVMFK